MPPTFRSSRSGRQFGENNANRTRTGQIDHDVFEGLPVRRWTRQLHTFSQTSRAEELDTAGQSTGGSHSLPELPMPKDSQLLSPASKALLRAARAGCIYIRRISKEGEDEEKETTDVGESAAPPKPERSFTARKWAVVPKHLEPPEVEFLAKRRPGLPSLYGATAGTTDVAPTGAAPPMRKTKFRKVDPVTGNVSIYEAWVPEGHKIEGEITDDAPIVPEKSDAAVIPEAPAPGTVVEGVGVVNEEGVVVAEAGSAAVKTPPKKRPPPPKRKGKGIGRGRRKKVMFAPGDDTESGAGAAHASAGVVGQNDGAMDVDMAKEQDGDSSRMSIDQSGQEEDEEEGDEGDDSDDGDDITTDAKTPDAAAQDSGENIAETVKKPVLEVVDAAAAEPVTERPTVDGAPPTPSGREGAVREPISAAAAATTNEADREDITALKADPVSEVNLSADQPPYGRAAESTMEVDQPPESKMLEDASASAPQNITDGSQATAGTTHQTSDIAHPSATGDASSKDVDMMTAVRELGRLDAPNGAVGDVSMREPASTETAPPGTSVEEGALRNPPASAAAGDKLSPELTTSGEGNKITERAEMAEQKQRSPFADGNESAGRVLHSDLEQSSDLRAKTTDSGAVDLLDRLEASLGEPPSERAAEEQQLPDNSGQAAAPGVEEKPTEQLSAEPDPADEAQPEDAGHKPPKSTDTVQSETTAKAAQPEQQSTAEAGDPKANSTASDGIESKDTASASNQPTTASQPQSGAVHIPGTAAAPTSSSPGPTPSAAADEDEKETKGD